MRPSVHWFAVPLLALMLPGLSPTASVPDGMASSGGPERAADPAGSTVPTHCLLERNHGACVTCCREAVDCGPSSTVPCEACSHFCQNSVPPPPAPEEPQP